MDQGQHSERLLLADLLTYVSDELKVKDQRHWIESHHYTLIFVIYLCPVYEENLLGWRYDHIS